MVRFEFIEKDTSLPWLLFIHGFAGNVSTWKKQIFEFKNEFNICLIDLPGHGYAKLEDCEKNCVNIFQKVAGDIIYKLKGKNIDKVTVVSFSMGTIVNYYMLKEDPLFCEKSIMVSAVCGGNWFLNLKGNIVKNINGLFSFNFLVDAFVDFILPRKEHKDLKPDVKSAYLDLGRDNFIFWYKSLKEQFNVMKENSLAEYKNIFFVVGDGDLNLKNGVISVANRENISIRIVENQSHLYPVEDTKDFNLYLYSLLK